MFFHRQDSYYLLMYFMNSYIEQMNQSRCNCVDQLSYFSTDLVPLLAILFYIRGMGAVLGTLTLYSPLPVLSLSLAKYIFTHTMMKCFCWLGPVWFLQCNSYAHSAGFRHKLATEKLWLTVSSLGAALISPGLTWSLLYNSNMLVCV